MKKDKRPYLLFIFFCVLLGYSQQKELRGQLLANDEVEGIHILNKTAAKYAISDVRGNFIILARTSDTLFISGLKYQSKELVITNQMMEIGSFSVQLIENVNELDEVMVGTFLTGSLQSDLDNSDAEPELNFYDLGIPGFIGKPLTLNEQKLHDADAGPMGAIMGGPYGGGLSLNFHKILNKISGRTKKLRAIVALDKRDTCIERFRREYASILFEKSPLSENLKNEFFLFCSEDIQFTQICGRNNDIEAIDFLKLKLKAYKHIRESDSKD